jgi:hypothetical protein
MIKTNKKIILETGQQIEESYDIELCGCSKLKNCNIDLFEEYAKQKNAPCFKQAFKTKEKFFYKIVQHGPIKISKYEVGVGHIESKNNKFLLIRDKAFYFSTDGENVSIDNDRFLNFECLPDEFLVISQYVPYSYIELLYEPHSVIVSEDAFLPFSVDIKKNSVLGRKGGLIESIKIEDLLSNLIRYNEQEECVEFNNGKKWIKLPEKINEDTK